MTAHLHPDPTPHAAMAWWRVPLACWVARFALVCAWSAALVCVAWANPSGSVAPGVAPDTTAVLQSEVQALLAQQHVAPADRQRPWRVSFELGALDPRLRLAPCARVKAYVPQGARLWGRTRVGLRCEQGTVHWNVFLPVTVRVWAPAVVAAAALRPGEPLSAADLSVAEVDLAARPAPAVLQPDALIGRSLARSIEAGQAIRADDVKPRRWFNAGDTVTVNLVGQGFRVQAEGRAMASGEEGQCARIRAENGKMLCAMPIGDRTAELRL